METIEPIDLLIYREIGRITTQYKIAGKMANYEYQTMTLQHFCGISKEGAEKVKFLTYFEREIEKNQNKLIELNYDLGLEIGKEIEEMKYKYKQAYLLFKQDKTIEDVKEATGLKNETLQEIKDLIKED